MRLFGLVLYGLAAIALGWLCCLSMTTYSIAALAWGVGIWFVFGGIGIFLNITRES